mgnify:FL=1
MANALEQVGPVDPAKTTSPIAEGPEPTGVQHADQRSPTICYFNGRRYSQGAVVCSKKQRLRCGGDGTWYLDGAC